MRPTRISHGRAEYLSVSMLDLRRVSNPAIAREHARAIIAASHGGLRTAFGGDAGEEQRLVEAILSGEIRFVALQEQRRVLDAPKTVDLASLAEPMDSVVEPPRPTAWIGIRVFDQRGRPLPFFAVELEDPTGKAHRADLDQGGAAAVGELADDGGCMITLTAMPGARK